VTQQSTDQSAARVPDSGNDRRVADERRAEDRRGGSLPVSEERRSGADRRYWEERRVSVDRERARARRLLNDFGTLSGTAERRLVKLVRRQWPSYPLGARALLVEALRPLLGGVTDGGTLTDDLRQTVEDTVADWAARI